MGRIVARDNGEVGPGSTPLRNIRIDDVTWQRAKDVAAERSTTVSALVRDALRALLAPEPLPAHLTDLRGEPPTSQP